MRALAETPLWRTLYYLPIHIVRWVPGDCCCGRVSDQRSALFTRLRVVSSRLKCPVASGHRLCDIQAPPNQYDQCRFLMSLCTSPCLPQLITISVTSPAVQEHKPEATNQCLSSLHPTVCPFYLQNISRACLLSPSPYPLLSPSRHPV